MTWKAAPAGGQAPGSAFFLIAKGRQAEGVAFALLLTGRGHVWLDDSKFECIPKNPELSLLQDLPVA